MRIRTGAFGRPYSSDCQYSITLSNDESLLKDQTLNALVYFYFLFLNSFIFKLNRGFFGFFEGHARVALGVLTAQLLHSSEMR